MTTLVGISGSLRRNSYNTALLRAAAASMPAGARIEIGRIADIPLYNADVETAEGIPAAVDLLKSQIAAADGILIVTPEYNHSIPGVLKNAIDWLSRPPADVPRVFGGRRVAIVGASQGGFGTILSQSAWLPVLRTLGTHLWTGDRLLVSRAATLFDAEGQLQDDRVAGQLRKFMAGFVEFARAATR